jgi:hypothetical protein
MDRVAAFEAERAALETEGVLTLSDAQAAAVRSYHGALRARLHGDQEFDIDAASGRLSLGLRIASFIGALSLAASLYLLLERTVDRLPDAVALPLVMLLPMALAAVAFVLQQRERSGYLARLVALISFAALVYDLGEVAARFGIAPSDRICLVLCLYAAGLSWNTRSTLLLAASVLSFNSYVAMRAGTLAGGYWLDFGRHPEQFFPAALVLLVLPEFVNLDRDRFGDHLRVWGWLTLLLPVLVLANVGDISLLPYAARSIAVFYQVAGFVLSAIAIGLGARQDRLPVVYTGVTFFVVFLYTKFYDWWWVALPRYLFFLIIGVTALLVMAVLRYARSRHVRAAEAGA